MIKARDIYALAQRSIKSNRLRTNLTITIIAIGITALIGIITVIEVLKAGIEQNFSGMGANTFNITNQQVVVKGGHGRRRRPTDAETNRIKLQETELFKSRYRYPATISVQLMAGNNAIIKRGNKKSNPNINIMATDMAYLKVAGMNLLQGRNFSTREQQSGESVCILGYAIAKKYFSRARLAENGLIQIGQATYRVIGVVEEKGASFTDRTDNMVFVTLMNARARFNLAQKSAIISIKVADIAQIRAAMDEAEGTMRSVKALHPGEANNFSVNKNDEVARSLISNIEFVTLAAGFIGFITLLGAAIGLMNIMLVSVAERTREIGLTKAIGASSGTILRQFLSEAIIISVKGGLIGMGIGILIGNLLSLVFKTSFIVPWMWLGIGLSICLIVGLAAGIYPALKASKLNPILALRYE
ncbi:MAG: ABC transporter permease [Chitinophagaceae bacterium]